MLTIFLQAAPNSNPYMMPIMMVAMIVGFYFLMIRPQMKKQKQEKKFQEDWKVGNREELTSGRDGSIAQNKEDGIVI